MAVMEEEPLSVSEVGTEGMVTMIRKILLKLGRLDARLVVIENKAHERKKQGESTTIVKGEKPAGRSDLLGKGLSQLGNRETQRRAAQLASLREEGSYLAYVNSFVAVVSKMELPEEEQTALFMRRLKEGQTKLIAILNPKTLQQAIAFGKVLVADEDQYGNQEIAVDMMVGSVHSESWCKAKQEGNISSSKTKQGASQEPLLGRMSMVVAKKNVYLPPHRRVTNAKTDEERARRLRLGCDEKFTEKSKCAPRDLYPLILKQAEEIEGEVVTILVCSEEEQEATLQLQVLPEISVTVTKQLRCASQPILAQGVTDSRKIQDVNQTTKRLEEVAITYRGPEKVDLLRRWVAVLKDLERLFGNFLEEKEIKGEQNWVPNVSRDSPISPFMASYYDPEARGGPMNFHDVFLHSRAPESITPSMNLEVPKEEEIPLLLGVFGVCLTGGKEAQNAIVSSVQNSIQFFAVYEDEVLVKKEELFQFAQSVITGLKFNYGIARIEVEATWLKKKLDEVGLNRDDSYADNTTLTTIGELKEALNGYFSPLPIPYFYGTTSNSEVEHVPRDIVAMLQLLRFHLHRGQRMMVQMVNPSFEDGHPGKSSVELSRMTDRVLRESRAIDKESFCAISGKMVWTIRIDLHTVDRGGNLVDVAKAVVLAVLLTYRRPECILEGKMGQEIIVQPPEAWKSLHLIIRYLPLAVTMAIIDEEGTVIIDPTHFEGAVLGRRMSSTVNTNGDDCAIQKEGAVHAPQSVIIDDLGRVATKVGDMTSNRERVHRKIKRQPSHKHGSGKGSIYGQQLGTSCWSVGKYILDTLEDKGVVEEGVLIRENEWGNGASTGRTGGGQDR